MIDKAELEPKGTTRSALTHAPHLRLFRLELECGWWSCLLRLGQGLRVSLTGTRENRGLIPHMSLRGAEVGGDHTPNQMVTVCVPYDTMTSHICSTCYWARAGINAQSILAAHSIFKFCSFLQSDLSLILLLHNFAWAMRPWGHGQTHAHTPALHTCLDRV